MYVFLWSAVWLNHTESVILSVTKVLLFTKSSFTSFLVICSKLLREQNLPPLVSVIYSLGVCWYIFFYEDYGIWKCNAVHSGTNLPTFRRNIMCPNTKKEAAVVYSSVYREESTIPIKIGLGYNVFPPHVIRRIDEMRSNSRWLSFQMLLIPIVELIVGGPMTAWPRVVVHHLFLSPPTTFSAVQLASFLYGNGLPRLLALKLVMVCNPNASDALLDEIEAMYSAWAAGGYVRLSIYWDMRRQTDYGSTLPMVQRNIAHYVAQQWWKVSVTTGTLS